jgi:hypothetical protein
LMAVCTCTVGSDGGMGRKVVSWGQRRKKAAMARTDILSNSK